MLYFHHKILLKFHILYILLPVSPLSLTDISTKEFPWQHSAASAYSWHLCCPSCAESQVRTQAQNSIPLLNLHNFLQESFTFTFLPVLCKFMYNWRLSTSLGTYLTKQLEFFAVVSHWGACKAIWYIFLRPAILTTFCWMYSLKTACTETFKIYSNQLTLINNRYLNTLLSEKHSTIFLNEKFSNVQDGFSALNINHPLMVWHGFTKWNTDKHHKLHGKKNIKTVQVKYLCLPSWAN
jgi:hypothetical protein